MKITSLKSIYLTKEELKLAILDYITFNHDNESLANHLAYNDCEIMWLQDENMLHIAMDGEYTENTAAPKLDSDPIYEDILDIFKTDPLTDKPH